MAHLLARWQAKLQNRHAAWHIGMPSWNTDAPSPYGMLARLLADWHVKIRSWHAFGMLARWYTGTKARWHINHADIKALSHIDHVGKQACTAHDSANPWYKKDILIYLRQKTLTGIKSNEEPVGQLEDYINVRTKIKQNTKISFI